MDMGLKNKTALVTGSTRGIGKAIALELAREGVHVLINGRNNDDVERTVAEFQAAFPETEPRNATADLVDSRQREALFAKFPHVDILVNSMGIYEIISYDDVDDAVWEKYFRTNFLAANDLTKFYLPSMLSREYGRIIFIARSRHAFRTDASIRCDQIHAVVIVQELVQVDPRRRSYSEHDPAGTDPLRERAADHREHLFERRDDLRG